MKKLLIVVVLSASAFLPGCLLLVGAAIVATAVSSNSDPISYPEGVATRDYSVSYERAWAGVESGLRAMEVVSEPPSRGPDSGSVRGRTKEGEPVDVRISKIYMQTRVEIKVGREDTQANRDAARAIHGKIDEDFQVLRRHYARNFEPVWEASKKSGLQDPQVVQPDNTLGQIQGKRSDGTPVIMTIQKVEPSRTRITIEVGTAGTPESRQQAMEMAKTISRALGIQSEEGD